MSSSADRSPMGTVLRQGEHDVAVPFLLGEPTGQHTATAVTPRAKRDVAHAEGYATGWAQGIREARAATADARQRAADELDRMLRERDSRAAVALAALAAAADQVRATTVQRAEDVLDATVAAAVDLGEAMAGATIAADLVGAARAGVGRTLAELPPAVPVTVRLNPTDHAELVSAGLAELAHGRTVTLMADSAVERGGAVAETEVTTVDATLSAAVRRVRAELAQ
jgi:flagellar assembly protein FliH